MSVFYDLILLLLGILYLPIFLYQFLFRKKYRKSLFQRLGFISLKQPQGKARTLWFHAVSMGEVKAMYSMILEAISDKKSYHIVITTVTETGNAEAKRLYGDYAQITYLPFDFSYLMKSFVRKIHPDLLVLVEGEYWWNCIQEAKKAGAKVVLINGKLSEKSFQRFQKVPFFSNRLFQMFDLLLLQSKEYEHRFRMFTKTLIEVVGNLKLGLLPEQFLENDQKSLREHLHLCEQDEIYVLASTHDREEQLLLTALNDLLEQKRNLKVLVVPRHPNRFEQVLKELHPWFPIGCYSKKKTISGKERILVIDVMGILPQCYQLAKCAIVGGSFVQHIGGHDIVEPIKYGCPVFFGPYMHSQQVLVYEILSSHAGIQTSLDHLPSLLQIYIEEEKKRQQLIANGKQLIERHHLIPKQAWKKIEKLCKGKVEMS